MTPAIELANVSKIYRRYGGRQFSTLKSALLQRSILRDLQPSEVFPALTDVSFTVPRERAYGIIGAKRLRQEHCAQARCRHYKTYQRLRPRRWAGVGADRAGGWFPPRDFRT